MSEEAVQQEQGGGQLTWFLIGVAVGAVCALLLAPRSGKETREFITQKTQQGCDAVTDTGRELYERGKEVYDKSKQVMDDAAALFERGRKLVSG